MDDELDVSPLEAAAEEEDTEGEDQSPLAAADPVRAELLRQSQAAEKRLSKLSQSYISQIEEAKRKLLAQPTELSRKEMLRAIANKLTQRPVDQRDPRFWERQNVFTMLRDIGELGGEVSAAEKKLKQEQEAKVSELEGLRSKYMLGEATRGASQAASALARYKPAGAKGYEIIDLQIDRDRLKEQRDSIDPRSPEYLNLSRRIQELDKRISYLGGERKEGGPEETVGEKALNKKIGEEYADWVVRGGAVQSASRISRINDIVSKLGKRTDISGPVVGFAVESLPTIASVLYPDAQDAKDVVESVVQTDLRAILGAQFAQKEGEALIKRAYNPRLGEEKNSRRLRLLALQMQMVNDEKNRAMTYFAENKGSMKGYTFRPFTANDFLTSDQLERLDKGESPEDILGITRPKPSVSTGEAPTPKGGEKVDPAERARQVLARRRAAKKEG